jgi:hypothetical protein
VVTCGRNDRLGDDSVPWIPTAPNPRTITIAFVARNPSLRSIEPCPPAPAEHGESQVTDAGTWAGGDESRVTHERTWADGDDRPASDSGPPVDSLRLSSGRDKARAGVAIATAEERIARADNGIASVGANWRLATSTQRRAEFSGAPALFCGVFVDVRRTQARISTAPAERDDSRATRAGARSGDEEARGGCAGARSTDEDARGGCAGAPFVEADSPDGCAHLWFTARDMWVAEHEASFSPDCCIRAWITGRNVPKWGRTRRSGESY